MSADPELLARAEEIRDETSVGANTATRVGGLLVDMVEAIGEDGDGEGLKVSIVGTTLVFTRSSGSEPVVEIGALSKSSLSARVGNTDSATFTISGRRLTDNILLSLSDITNFALSASSLTPVDGRVSSTTITVTYQPQSGTEGTVHPCDITIKSDGVTYGTLSLSGTVASAPSITLTPSTLALSALEDEVGSGTINVSGTALDGDITLTLSGASYMSFSDQSTVTTLTVNKADAEAPGGHDVTIYYTGTASDSGTLTASSAGATNVTATLTGTVREAEPAGTTFNNDDDTLTFTVLDKTAIAERSNTSFKYAVDDISTPIVAVKAGSVAAESIEIPATVQYNGITYTVSEISNGLIDSGGAQNANTAGAFYNKTSLKYVTFAPGSKVKMIGRSAFHNCSNLESFAMPSSLTRIGSATGSYSFAGCSKLASITIPSGVDVLNGYLFNGCTKLMEIVVEGTPQFGGNVFNGCTQFSQTDDGTLTTTPEGLAKLPVVECHSVTAPAKTTSAVNPWPRNSENWISAIMKYPSGSESSYGVQADHEYSYSPRPTISGYEQWWHFMVKQAITIS